MQPVNFPEANEKLAKSQPQYRPLPVCIRNTHEPEVCKTCEGAGGAEEIPGFNGSPGWTCPQCRGVGHYPVWKEFTCKYELSDFELAQINKTRSFFFTESGYGFNPILPQVENHFNQIPVSYTVEESNYKVWIPLNDDTEHCMQGSSAGQVLEEMLKLFPELTAEQVYFYERPTVGIDEAGNLTQI